MAFISVFDVLGPNMIGPSSSHTAGAEIIAFLAQKMIAPPLKRADFTLYGSFAKTYHGHGTDRALLGGIMGFSADDTRIRDSFAIATDRGLGYIFYNFPFIVWNGVPLVCINHFPDINFRNTNIVEVYTIGDVTYICPS